METSTTDTATAIATKKITRAGFMVTATAIVTAIMARVATTGTAIVEVIISIKVIKITTMSIVVAVSIKTTAIVIFVSRLIWFTPLEQPNKINFPCF